MTPEERTLRARLAAYTLHSNITDESAHTAPARRGLEESWARKVDPHGILPDAERERRAAQLRKAHYARMALKSSLVRRARAGAA